MNYFSSSSLAVTLSTFSHSNPIEVRAINKQPENKVKIVSGFFDNVELLEKEIQKHDSLYTNWYLGFNEVDAQKRVDLIIDKDCHNTLKVGQKCVSNDMITCRKYLLIDIDPVRETNTSSTNKELAYAESMSERVYDFLKIHGFKEPIKAMSGSGIHLLYACDIEANQQTDILVNNFLKILDTRFSDDKAHIDTVVGKRAQLTKLYGTIAKKGENTAERPHRMSEIRNIPNPLEITDLIYIQTFVNKYIVKENKPCKYNNFGGSNFDVRMFLNEHNISFTEKPWKDGYKLVLDECVFNPEHKAPDSAVFVYADGSLGFHCFHNSCSNYHWKEFREKVEGVSITRGITYITPTTTPPVNFEDTDASHVGNWLRFSSIKIPSATEFLHIPTQYKDIDEALLGGLNIGGVSVLTGHNSSGKTVFLQNLILNVCDNNYKVGLWSGEMLSFEVKKWFLGIAKGNNIESKEIDKKIGKYLDDRLLILDNTLGSDWTYLQESMKFLAEKEKVNLIVLDNLSIMGANSNNIYEQQSEIMRYLSNFSKQYSLHIILVAHSNKQYSNQTGGGIVRKQNISGHSNLSNLADNVFIVHKVDNDFNKSAKEVFGKEKADVFKNYHAIVEVAKSRFGLQENFVGLYHHLSKRMSTDIVESKNYTWAM